MPIDLASAAITLILGLAIGGLVGWLASRPGLSRLQNTLEKDRAVHAERLKAYSEAESKLREAFQALSADALRTNNEAFLSLAETRLGFPQVRSGCAPCWGGTVRLTRRVGLSTALDLLLTGQRISAAPCSRERTPDCARCRMRADGMSSRHNTLSPNLIGRPMFRLTLGATNTISC